MQKSLLVLLAVGLCSATAAYAYTNPAQPATTKTFSWSLYNNGAGFFGKPGTYSNIKVSQTVDGKTVTQSLPDLKPYQISAVYEGQYNPVSPTTIDISFTYNGLNEHVVAFGSNNPLVCDMSKATETSTSIFGTVSAAPDTNHRGFVTLGQGCVGQAVVIQ